MHVILVTAVKMMEVKKVKTVDELKAIDLVIKKR